MPSRVLSLLCMVSFGAAAYAGSAKTIPSYGQVSPSFEVNRGQTDARVEFLSRGPGYTVFLMSNQAVLSLKRGTRSQTVTMRFAGSNARPSITGLHSLPGKTNYFIGNEPRNWRTNIPTYSEVLYRHIYPSIDLLYHANQRQLEFDVRVAPHADPNIIEFSFTGSRALRVADNGDLLVTIDDGELRFCRPHLYQSRGARRQALPDGSYVLIGERVKFSLPSYDRTQTLVIDPMLGYSTFLGGSADSFGNAIAVDSAGHAYVAGGTTSSDFPATSGSYQPTYGGTTAVDTKV